MTTEDFTATTPKIVNGIGPYPVSHPYRSGALNCSVVHEGVLTDLDAADFTVDPLSSETTGNITLTAAAAAAHAGKTLYVRRSTDIENGWAGTSARERGLEAQLDWVTEAVQDLIEDQSYTVRTQNPVGRGLSEPSTALLFDDLGRPTPGPDASAITAAAANAEIAAAAATVATTAVDGIFDSDALAYIAAGGSAATPAQQMLINTTVQRLKLAGIWDKLDTLFFDFGISEAAALIDMKNPAHVAVNNGASFTAGAGFTGDGVSAWIDTGLSADDLSGFRLNSASLGLWITLDVLSDGRDIGFSGSAEAYIISRSSSGNTNARINDTTAITDTTQSASGLRGINRSGGSARQLYHNGVRVDTDAQVSTNVPAGNLSVLRGNNVYSPRRVAGWWAGSALTLTEWDKLYDILKDVRDEVILTPVAQLLDYRARTVAQTVNPAGGTLATDLALGHVVLTTLSQNTTLADPANWPTGVARMCLIVTQDATGGWDITWPAGWLTEAGGPAPQPSPGAGIVTEIYATSYDGGATVRLSMGGVWNA